MMKTHYTIALAMLAGFGLGTVAVQDASWRPLSFRRRYFTSTGVHRHEV
jgi:hypothetical protein